MLALALSKQHLQNTTMGAITAIYAAMLSALVGKLKQNKRLAMRSTAKLLATYEVGTKRQRERIKRCLEGAPCKKKAYVYYERERTRRAIQTNYIGPFPIFNDRQFERKFRLTRTVFQEKIIPSCFNTFRSFYKDTRDCCGRRSIDPYAKIMIALKHLCYGACVSSYTDYFQMGNSTAEKCLEMFIKAIGIGLADVYMRSPTKEDAKRLTRMHKSKHGIDGMMGSLDCTHFFWKNCPVYLQGVYQGKEKKPTVVMEASADYTLWLWDVSVGYPGSWNDIDIWESSPLHKRMTHGCFEDLDFNFTIAGITFNKLFYLVDGIYPKLARFVQSFTEPTTTFKKKFAKWQEAC